MTQPSVVWFRRDLRLEDHPALDGSVRSRWGAAAVRDRPGVRRQRLASPCRSAQAVGSLSRATGGALVVRGGDPVDVVPRVAAEVDADTVFVSKDYGPYGRRRDGSVASALRAQGACASRSRVAVRRRARDCRELEGLALRVVHTVCPPMEAARFACPADSAGVT